MKVMKMAAKKGRGDDYNDRLLSYLQKQFKESIVKMISIRDSVFFIETDKNEYVIKGYNKLKKLRLQEVFTSTLRKEGFEKTYSFLPHLSKELLFFEGTYFGCIEYLHPHPKEFTYHTHSNREEGLKLLDEFHSITASFVKRYHTLLPLSDILEKWTDRLRIFTEHYSQVRYFLKEKEINELIEWSHWSLKGLRKNAGFFTQKPHVILHGDVAHHNFLRDRTGTLRLIDFDLIGIGPQSMDMLQYANRILPHIDWSLEKLAQYPQIALYLKEEAFLYALAFPTDILREWNRILRGHKQKQRHYQQVISLTIDELHLRKNFFNEVNKAVKNLK